jgi:hypothetical protein
VIEPAQWTFPVPSNAIEQYRSKFLCETENGVVATPGPRLLPPDNYEPGKGIKVLVIVEDSSQSGYLRWYWAYLGRAIAMSRRGDGSHRFPLLPPGVEL